MGYLDFSNFLGGFNQQSEQLRREEQHRADHQWDLNRRTLEWLATSDDPEIRAAAVTGILDQSGPKPKKGLAGWFGEVQAHPAFQTINTLLNTPVTAPETTYVRNPETSGAMTPISKAGAPGQMMHNPEFDAPESASVEPPPPPGPPGQPPAQPTMRGGPKGTNWWDDQGVNEPMRGGSGKPDFGMGGFKPSLTPIPLEQQTRMVTHRREAFKSPTDQIADQTAAQITGKIRGITSAMSGVGAQLSPEDLQEMALGMAGAPRRRTQYTSKFVQFRDGSTGAVSFDTATARYIDNEGNDISNQIARELPRSGGGGTGKIVTDRVWDPDLKQWRRVEHRQQADGSWIDVDMGEGTPPSDTIVPGEGGVYRVPKAGPNTAEQVPGVVPRKPGGGTGSTKSERDAKDRVKTIKADLDAIEREGKLGGIVSMGQLDKAAQRRNYKNYRDARAAYDAARRAAGVQATDTRGAAEATQPPPAPGGAPGGGFGTAQGADAIRRFLPSQQ